MKKVYYNLKWKICLFLLYKFKYCIKCSFENNKLTKNDWNFHRCYSCIDKLKYGRQG